MKKESALQLKRDVWRWAEVFSDEGREFNYKGEKYSLDSQEDIHVLSDDLVGVVYSKSSEKKALAILYHVNSSGGKWIAFFPTDSHLAGLNCEELNKLKRLVEKHNFPLNFVEEKVVVK